MSAQHGETTPPTLWTLVDPHDDEHEGYVAGQRADGTRASAAAQDTTEFIAYLPRCECGWTGPCFSPTPAGYAACEQLWREQHLASFLTHGRSQPALRASPRTDRASIPTTRTTHPTRQGLGKVVMGVWPAVSGGRHAGTVWVVGRVRQHCR